MNDTAGRDRIPEPVSAPPVRKSFEANSDDPYDSMKGGVSDADEWNVEGIRADAEAAEREESYGSADTHRDPYFGAEAPVVASAPAPLVRYIMRVSNRYNWHHFYTMPADVGYQNVPGLIRAMQEEGCKITDIQITFEVQELK